MSFFDSYRTVWVFYPVNKSIAWSDTLVYSYLAYQTRLGKPTNDSKVAWATGLCRQTIPRVLERLGSLGLYNESGPINLAGTFRDKQGNGRHWSLDLAYWKCLVRTEGSPLNVASTMVFSYLLDKKLAGFKPSQGWSFTYLANALGMDRRTVESSLNILTTYQLFKSQGRRWLVPSSLVDMQPGWFAKVQESITLDSFEPDFTKVDLNLVRTGFVDDEIDTSSVDASLSKPQISKAQVIGDRYCQQLKPLVGLAEAEAATRAFIGSNSYFELFYNGTLRSDWESRVVAYAVNDAARSEV